MGRTYRPRNPGDVVGDGGELIESVNGIRWKIRCKCGNIFIAQPSDTSGRCRECGYRHLSKARTVHGEAPKSGIKNSSRLYGIWLNMRSRCNNKNNKRYHDYGGRGITVCDEWNNYPAFKEWALANGYRDDLSIDRIDVNGGYCPENCRWATQREQMRNVRCNHLLTYNGQTRTMAEWAEFTGIKYHTLKKRINKYGWDIGRALNYPELIDLPERGEHSGVAW